MAALKPYTPALALVSFLASASISARLVGGLLGSSPACLNSLVLMYSSGIDELNGIEYCLPLKV